MLVNMTRNRTLAFALWLLQRHDHLNALYKDYKEDNEGSERTNFLEFCTAMYVETKYYEDQAPGIKNQIEIRVIAEGSMVKNVYSNVSGILCDVDIIDLGIDDPNLQEKAHEELKTIESIMHKIF
jgi:hypothetical protein